MELESSSELEINRLFRTRYSITTNITNGTSNGDEYIWTQENATIILIPNENHILPSSITMVNASYIYDNTTGIVNLSNPIGNVTITAECESAV